MASTAQAEVQALLRFLTQDAKLGLAEAMSKVNVLRKHTLNTPNAISKADSAILKQIFDDEKVLKQVHNAAKRTANPKKRAASGTSGASSLKRTKHGEEQSDQEIEAALALPHSDEPIETLQTTTIETNRAPLFLAFAVTVLKYTHPDQPLSSRLSLAQAVTSTGAQSKAKYIGLTSSTAEEEGWGHGQPKLRVMGREIAVMRRQMHLPSSTPSNDAESQDTVEAEDPTATREAFWGIDLEALKKSNGPLVAGKLTGTSGPPIHAPLAARSYLLKSIDLADVTAVKDGDSSPKKKKPSAGEIATRKERAVALLLHSLDLLFASWAPTLSADELDRRAGSWYTRVRPDVEHGPSGWGQRGKVPLQDILDLKRNE